MTGTTLGSCGVLAGLLVIFLPETKGLPMCETVIDVENRSYSKRPKKNYQRTEDDFSPNSKINNDEENQEMLRRLSRATQI